MIQVTVFSGFLGAGKTTLIKKLLADGYKGEKVVLIENEFGEIGIDGGFLKDAGIEITEMNSGCICCSLVGDFGKALTQVKEQFHPDRILIEPSGVGKLSDVVRAIEGIGDPEMVVTGLVTVVDAGKCRIYMKNFGEFFNNQVECAHTILLSRSQNVSEDKLQACVKLLREKNAEATIVTTPWDDLTGAQILAAMETKVDLAKQLLEEAEHHHHHDDDECDDPECECHHHHHDDDDEDEHEHHHHHHDDDDDDEHEHHHHHHHDGEECDDPECECHHHHDGHHHHHHHADEVFTSFGRETVRKYEEDTLKDILEKLANSEDYGIILRAKGMVPDAEGKWHYFDLTPGEYEIRDGAPDIIGRICVIGSKMNEDAIKELFELD
ncbi:MAG: cobalamin biosynthesis protein CobW [Lachnospiraceae bacterium]|nr:cobalamin biosynthesis protein CobW [Lachnospiraceae bacterium]